MVEFEKDGMEMEIGYDKDGNILFIETEIDCADPSENVNTFIRQNYPKVEIEGAGKIVKSTEDYYEVEIEYDELESELLFDADGNFMKEVIEAEADNDGEEEENEIEINLQDLPDAVKNDISTRYPGSSLLEADKITHDNGDISNDVEIKTADGEVIELMYKPDGTYLGLESDDD